MKIRLKLAIFIGIYIIIWIVAMGTIFNSIAMHGYDILEEESFKANINRLQGAIDDVVAKSDPILTDWANWDDTYAYIHAPTDKYINSNISSGFMKDIGLDYVLIYGPDEKFISGFKYDDGDVVEQVPEIVISTIVGHKNETNVMLHKGRPLIFSTKQITTTDETAPKKGLLVFAFYLDRDHVKEIQDRLELDIELVSVSEKFLSEEQSLQIYEHDTFKTVLFRYPYVNDPHSIALQFRHPLDIIALGKKTMREVMVASVIAFIVISTILYVYVKSMLDRVKNLSLNVDKIAHERDLSLRLETDKNDEITMLTRDINLMLDRIETMNKQIVEYATVDVLTRVYNRRVGFEKLEDLIGKFGKAFKVLSICYIDINNLKLINDTKGHSCGDVLIKTVSSTVEKHLEDWDIICRLGGDEFLVIFPGQTIEQSRAKIKSAEEALKEKQVEKNIKYPITISKGFASYDGTSTIQAFIEEADQSMYKDKKRNKKRRLTDWQMDEDDIKT